MRNFRKALSVTAASALLCTAFSFSANALQENSTVHIVVENNTFTKENGAVWTGTLVDEWLPLTDGSSAADLLDTALSSHGYTQTGAQSNYVTDINGLSAGADADKMGGWMVGYNDWYGNGGISTLSLTDGDEVALSYSLSWGADIGSDFYSTDTSLKSLTVGDQEVALSDDSKEYSITLPEGTESIRVIPVASNKNYSRKIYKNNYTPDTEGTDYKSSKEIPVENGDVIYIGVGHSAWLSYPPEGLEETVYSLKLTIEEKKTDPEEKTETGSETESEEGSGNENETGSQEKPDKESEPKDNSDTESVPQESNTEDESDQDNTTDENAGSEQDKSDNDKNEETGSETNSVSIQTIINSTADDLKKDVDLTAVGNEWAVLSLARSGLMDKDTSNKYADSIYQYLNENKSNKATDYAKFIIVLTALGYNAEDFRGMNLIAELSDYDFAVKQGINGAAYSLIALDTHDYSIPSAPEGAEQSTRENLIGFILSAQLSDGGWAFFGEAAEPDMTGIVLQALAPYYSKDENVKAAVDKALLMLSEIQNDDGTYTSYGAPNCENSAQIVTALSALGIDADKDTRFVKENGSALDGLKKFYIDGSFSHELNGEPNALSTLQAFYSACAYQRFTDGKTSLYDMSDVIFAEIKDDNNDESSDDKIKDEKDPYENEQSDPEINNNDDEPSDIISDNNSDNNNSNDSTEQNTRTVPTGDNDCLPFVIISIISASVMIVLFIRKKIMETKI